MDNQTERALVKANARIDKLQEANRELRYDISDLERKVSQLQRHLADLDHRFRFH